MSKELAKQKAKEFLTQNIDLSKNTGSGIAKNTIYKYTQEQVDKLIEIAATTDSDSDLAFYDDINNEFETEHDLPSIKRYIQDNFIDGNEMHPNFFGFDIYKKIGSCEIEETNENREGFPVFKIVYRV